MAIVSGARNAPETQKPEQEREGDNKEKQRKPNKTKNTARATKRRRTRAAGQALPMVTHRGAYGVLGGGTGADRHSFQQGMKVCLIVCGVPIERKGGGNERKRRYEAVWHRATAGTEVCLVSA